MENQTQLHQFKTRIIGRKGNELFALKKEDVALILTENRVTYALGYDNKKYICEQCLSMIESDLDPHMFFRANRQNIVNIEFIKSFKIYERVKILVNVQVEEITHSVIISQGTSRYFKEWISRL